MKYLKILKIRFLIFLMVFLFDANISLANQIKNLTILAEPNMVMVLTKLARIYSQKNAVIVSIGFASSADLINDIDAGEPADIFISAHKDWISNLKQKGLVDIYSVSHIASDGLVLVTSINNQNIPSSLLDKNVDFLQALKILNQTHSVLIVDNAGSSLGQYSHNLLNSMQLPDIKIFEKLGEDKTSIFNLINANTENYTILLASQVKDRPLIKVLSTQKEQDIFYQALVIAGDNMEGAREFSRFLKSPQAKIIFKESGFAVD